MLGKDDPFVVRVLGNKTPLAAATEVIEGTRIDRADERKRLIDGGKAATAASTDPLIVLARDVYPMRLPLANFREIGFTLRQRCGPGDGPGKALRCWHGAYAGCHRLVCPSMARARIRRRWRNDAVSDQLRGRTRQFAFGGSLRSICLTVAGQAAVPPTWPRRSRRLYSRSSSAAAPDARGHRHGELVWLISRNSKDGADASLIPTRKAVHRGRSRAMSKLGEILRAKALVRGMTALPGVETAAPVELWFPPGLWTLGVAHGPLTSPCPGPHPR